MSTASSPPKFLIFDCESVPDGQLLARTKYSDEPLTPEAAIDRAQQEARAQSPSGSDFLPVTYHIPVAICVARVDATYRLEALRCLDAPHFRTAEMVRDFWKGVNHYKARLVTFNGRGFDLPLLELAAFRYGVNCSWYFTEYKGPRNRYGDLHLDLHDFLTNFGAIRLAGGLNLLSKLLGKPGKVDTWGHHVYDLWKQGRVAAINEYCSFDVLDTYFVFLRTRVMVGDITLEQEQQIVQETRQWLVEQVSQQPHLQRYLDNWGAWQPWP